MEIDTQIDERHELIEAAGTIKKLASSEFSVLVEVEDEKFELHFDYLGWLLIARITRTIRKSA